MTTDTVPIATIVITTKNRKDELAIALASAIAQSAPVEVIVIDDGSDDGTSEMVRTRFPMVRLEQQAESAGLIVRRNLGARLARAPIIVSIDDDAEFSTPHVVEQALRGFADERVGAIAIPFKEPHKTGDLLFQQPPTPEVGWATYSFIGTAHALRRDLFLALGGYRETLIHQGEEGDYTLRLIDAGYRVELGVSDPILHYESPKRDHRRMDYYGSRNLVLFAWQNVPMPDMVPTLFVSTVKALLHTRLWPRLKVRAGALLDGYRLLPRTKRKPVSRQAYRLYRRLKKSGPVQL